MLRPQGPTRRRARPIDVTIGGVGWFLWYDPWRGCSPPVRRPSVGYDWVDVWKQYWEDVDAMKKPSVLANATVGEVTRVEPPKLLAKLTNVIECVCQPNWEDGERKGQRAVMVFLEGMLVKILLKVESPPLKLMVSGRSWDEAWAALEAVLRSDSPPWEYDEPKDKAGARKKK